MNKQCNICKEIKDISEFGSNKRYHDGKARRCLECHRLKNKKFRENNPDKQKQYSIKWAESHPDYQNEYYTKNKEHINKRTAANQKKNRLKVSSNHKRWAAKHRDKVRGYGKKHYYKYKEKISIYTKNNKHKYKKRHLFNNLKRRDRKATFDSDYTFEQQQITLAVFDNKCHNCGSTEKLSIDHYYPLSDGNPLSISNAIVLCRNCNSSKHNKLPEDFFTIDKWMLAEEIMKKAAEIYEQSLLPLP